ncbi:hypothetical protein [Propylenella binzhouense]|uniref:Uncharacterized protein n=1 Tax=Propylenella binzhouense TaxID=2555902 RepID=A0A964T6Y7_9HYPH|nr:hypothetical protein [Propylenella binzhouense]MYZ49618.1 hypothetical protein [Propylenella binzhouense]
MAEIPLTAIRESVAAAIESGAPLDIEREAHRIALIYGPRQEAVERELRAAGLKANVEFARSMRATGA